ncbi:Methyltransferase domain-containing protein [Haloechinothrix alba]|uniref:Methyltransferase domain-containing protein n=1 Tax=Haloechinothrix alba TaxID=664784 RepID=A0A238V4B6_9PSEU|nr:class I SAM-dependent methyltransferase [Haloechinothrix alba]SNR29068.1 Methyltransferase domain-containing protein [Haloechinothrix alba]
MLQRLRRAARAKIAVTAHRLADRLAEPQRAETERLRDEVTHLREETEQHLDKMRAELGADIERAVNRAIDHIGDFEVRSRRDTFYAGDRAAALESSRFAEEHLVGCPAFAHPAETLRHGLSLAPRGGLALEFGVATGTTLRQIAEARGDGRVYGFDSFEGLPEAWLPGIAEGTFAMDEPPDVPGAELVVGLFDDTLPGFLTEHPGSIDFVHIDSDLFSAAATVLEQLEPRLGPGSVIVFDEFFNYPGWQRHEYRAWREFVDRTGIGFSYEAYTYHDRQVVVRLT